ncbi:MAG: hypothetical protein IH586_10450, partial [Anaerolineaceae bacterium]|nr:hypothetical protein [Anaerolineaceae bacterium]
MWRRAISITSRTTSVPVRSLIAPLENGYPRKHILLEVKRFFLGVLGEVVVLFGRDADLRGACAKIRRDLGRLADGFVAPQIELMNTRGGHTTRTRGEIH